MRRFRTFMLMVSFLLLSSGVVAATSVLDEQFSKLPLPTQLWIKLEAKRESANNNVSRETALKAINAAGHGLNLASLPVDTVVSMVMANIVKDAESEIRELLAGIEQSNNKKKDQRDLLNKQRNQTSSIAAIKINRTAVLDSALRSQKVEFDSLSFLSEDQQLKLQIAIERRAKAEEALSNTLKKMSDTQSSLVGNVK